MSARSASARPTSAQYGGRLSDRAATSALATGEGGCWRQALTDPVIWALVGVGLALRLLVWATMPEHGFVSDETEYYAAARVLADGRGFSYYDAAPWLRPPGYILMLAAPFRLFGPTIAPVQTSSGPSASPFASAALKPRIVRVSEPVSRTSVTPFATQSGP